MSASVLGHDNLVQLVNRSGRTLIVYGYDGDQYARLLGDGTVQLNLRSPAFYLNEYRFGDQHVPSYADAKAPPRWRTMDHSGELAWHDHRIHAAKGGDPPSGTEPNTLIKSYRIPLRIGARSAAVAGDLYWIGGRQGTSWELFALPSLVVILGLLVFGRRRRPSRSGGALRTGSR